MRWGWKTPVAGLVALLLATGLAACGGGGSSSTATTETSPAPAEGAATGFRPQHHHDSGGGSAQFRVKGGDNSIQDFGSEVEGAEFEQAATALHDFLDARAAGDWAATCAYLSKSTVESLESLAARSKSETSCQKILRELTNPAAAAALKAEAAQADVRSLRSDGKRAFLIYTGPEKTVFAISMAHEDGAWKVTSLAGTPLS